MSPTNLVRSWLAAAVAAGILLSAALPAAAQSSRRSNSVFSLLTKKETAAELKLSDDQQKKIRDLSKNTRLPREQSQPYIKRLGEARTSTEKAKIREEMAEASRKQIEKVQADALAVLTAEQKTQFEALRYRSLGTYALVSEEIVKKLDIKEDQKKQLEELLKERFAAWQKIPSRERNEKEVAEKFKVEWDEKTLALLTPDQKAGWEKLTGVTPSDSKQPVDPKAGGKSDPKSDPSKTAPSKPVVSRSLRTPVGPYVASFAPAKSAARNDTQPKTNYGKGPINRNEKRFLSFNFENAPWKIVLEYFAKQANLTLDITQVPPDTFNYRDSNLYSVTEALDVMNGYLLGKKWLLIRRDKFLVAHNLENPVPPNIVPDVDMDDLSKRGRNELMRVTFTLNEDVDVKTIAKELEDLVSQPYGKVLSFDGSRQIMVTDIGTNLLRVKKIVGDSIGQVKLDDPVSKAFFCKHISAADAARVLTEQLDAARTVRNVSTNAGGTTTGGQQNSRTGGRGGRDGGRGRGGSPFGGGGGPFGGRFGTQSPFGGFTAFGNRGTTGTSTTTRQTGNTAVRVTAEPRTNSVLVTATARQVKLAEGIIKAIDVEIEGQSRFNDNNNRAYFKVYSVRTVNVADATRTLAALLPDVVINNTENTQTVANPANRFRGTSEITKGGWIHIMATADDHKLVAEYIREMDGPTGQIVAKTIKMKSLNPMTVGKTLLEMFQNDASNAPVINANEQARLLFVRGTPDQIRQVETFINEWESQSKSTIGVGDGKVRTFNVSDPEILVPLIKQLSGNKIRVILPNKASPVREMRTPSRRGGDSRVPPGDGRRTTDRKDRPLWDDFYRRTTRIPQISSDSLAVADADVPPGRGAFSTTSDSAEDAGKTAADTAADANAPVRMTILNGQIILTSDDKKALDEAQQLIEKLISMVPTGNRWTVFYLQAADCTDAATMLEQLFPSSSVSTATTANSGGMFAGLTGGVSSFANTLGNMSGLNSLKDADTLRIIPEVRSNALFVSGPSGKVRDVENMLKVLDATDLPGTLRDRVPRMIPVRYADVNEVASIIRDVYRDYMQPAGGANQTNPLAMLMQASQGGGRGSRGGRNGGGRTGGGGRQQPAQLTLGIDSRTGQLIVSANDTLYNQIEDMVYKLDVSAAVAQRTTRVVRLENAQPTVVTQALTAMYPNISVSVTSGQSGTPGSGTGGTNQFNTGNSSNDRAARAMMFQQLMRGNQGGNDGGQGGRGGQFGGGGSPFGGGRIQFGGGNRGGGQAPSFGGGSRGGRGGGGRRGR